MPKGHTYLRRKPGRRDAERKKFAALMRKVEAVRLALRHDQEGAGRRTRRERRRSSRMDDRKNNRPEGDRG
jgi:hypothetical protein